MEITMPLYSKILIVSGTILILSLLGFTIYKQNEISTRQLAIETEVVNQKQLVDGIVRSQNEYATRKDIEQFVKDNGINLKAIQSDLSKLHAEITAINVVSTSSQTQVEYRLPSTNTGPDNPNPIPNATCKDGSLCTNLDTYNYLKTQQNLTLNENFGKIKVPFGTVGFSAWQQNPWNLDIKSRQYNIATITGMDENQRTYVYNKFTLKVDGVDFEIPIDNAITKQEYPEPKFSWWNPRLFMGIDSGININKLTPSVSPTLGIGIMSYGQFKNNPDLSILQAGLGYDMLSKTPQVTITPLTYNIGKHIPLMTNLHLGPSFSLGFNGDFALMLGFRIGL
jgi:hypothetical protein